MFNYSNGNNFDTFTRFYEMIIRFLFVFSCDSVYYSLRGLLIRKQEKPISKKKKKKKLFLSKTIFSKSGSKVYSGFKYVNIIGYIKFLKILGSCFK